MNSKDIVIKEPKTEEEFKEYFDLLWRILRKPWDQPKGSEQDEMDENSIHIMAISNNKIVGCGRGHFNSTKQAQIRYMAVDDDSRRQGVGLRILKALEEELTRNGAKEIILKARENAVSFYEKHGYKIYKEGEILFGEIKHYWMRK
ncbi:MAG: GNAT family N-acetyltransferase, partial [Candidatus Cloacimonetes bacterium]|jgi:N-acetylglutamate synthase-like GNAT family acetyltransferase|nr:GNAT family N-acetyltransferase [Candidatus Cloacimonadota bacterium]